MLDFAVRRRLDELGCENLSWRARQFAADTCLHDLGRESLQRNRLQVDADTRLEKLGCKIRGTWALLVVGWNSQVARKSGPPGGCHSEELAKNDDRRLLCRCES